MNSANYEVTCVSIYADISTDICGNKFITRYIRALDVYLFSLLCRG